MAEPAGRIRVEVIHAPAPRQVWLHALDLPAGSQARDALQASGLFEAFPSLGQDLLAVSCWGRSCQPADLLRDGDRLEVCRALRVDPKVARRERFTAQGARTAGLFARRRAGAKAGY